MKLRPPSHKKCLQTPLAYFLPANDGGKIDGQQGGGLGKRAVDMNSSRAGNIHVEVLVISKAASQGLCRISKKKCKGCSPRYMLRRKCDRQTS